MKKFIQIFAVLSLLHGQAFGAGFNFGDSWCPSCQATPGAIRLASAVNINSKALIAPISITKKTDKTVAPKFVATIAACLFLAFVPVMVGAPFMFIGVSAFNGAKYGKPGFYFGAPRSKTTNLGKIGLRGITPKLTKSIKLNNFKFGQIKTVNFSRIKIGR